MTAPAFAREARGPGTAAAANSPRRNTPTPSAISAPPRETAAPTARSASSAAVAAAPPPEGRPAAPPRRPHDPDGRNETSSDLPGRPVGGIPGRGRDRQSGPTKRTCRLDIQRHIRAVRGGGYGRRGRLREDPQTAGI